MKYFDKKKTKKLKIKRKTNFFGLGKINYIIFKFLCARFRL